MLPMGMDYQTHQMEQLVLENAGELLQNTCLFHVCIWNLHHSEMQ